MKQSKIFMLLAAMALSMFTIGCTESDELTDITHVREAQQLQEEEEPISDDFSKALAAIQGISDVSVEDVTGYDDVTSRYYTFYYNQQVDHSNQQLGTFKQRVRIRLSQQGLKAPVVLYSHGYNMQDKPSDAYASEMTDYLKASTLWIEHRYFGLSLPEPFENLEFTYLNADQAAQDMHAIVALLKKTVFKESGKWVSTGISKDGITTGLYAYYSDKYGWNDIDLYMPFCAPFLEGTPQSCDDPQIGHYLYKDCGNNYPAGSQEQIAYERLRKIPTALMQDEALRTYCLQLFHQYHPADYVEIINTFGRDEEKATAGLLNIYVGKLFDKFSYVLFKQWAPIVPDVDAAIATATTKQEQATKAKAIEQLATFIFMDDKALEKYLKTPKTGKKVSNNDGTDKQATAKEPLKYSDADLLNFRSEDPTMPYYVQAVRELGNIRYDFSVLEGYKFPESTNNFVSLIASVSHQFETSMLYNRYASQWDGGQLMKSFRQWVKTQNKFNMIFCYSANDPWTGGAIDESTNPKVKRFICQNGTHSDYFLNKDYYTEEEKQQLLGYVNSFLGM